MKTNNKINMLSANHDKSGNEDEKKIADAFWSKTEDERKTFFASLQQQEIDRFAEACIEESAERLAAFFKFLAGCALDDQQNFLNRPLDKGRQNRWFFTESLAAHKNSHPELILDLQESLAKISPPRREERRHFSDLGDLDKFSIGDQLYHLWRHGDQARKDRVYDFVLTVRLSYIQRSRLVSAPKGRAFKVGLLQYIGTLGDAKAILEQVAADANLKITHEKERAQQRKDRPGRAYDYLEPGGNAHPAANVLSTPRRHSQPVWGEGSLTEGPILLLEAVKKQQGVGAYLYEKITSGTIPAAQYKQYKAYRAHVFAAIADDLALCGFLQGYRDQSRGSGVCSAEGSDPAYLRIAQYLYQPNGVFSRRTHWGRGVLAGSSTLFSAPPAEGQASSSTASSASTPS